MHLHLIPENKTAIFWSPRCGHRSLYHLLSNWSIRTIEKTTQDYLNIKEKDINGYTRVALVRDPIKRFQSSWRWGFETGLVDTNNIKPQDFIGSYNTDRYIENVEHHFAPQWSQASCLLNGEEEFYDITNFSMLANRLASLLNKDAKNLPDDIKADSWNPNYKPIDIPNNFLDLYQDDVNQYNYLLSLKKIKL